MYWFQESDYFTPQGEFRVDAAGSPILLNCLMYKMCYHRFGEMQVSWKPHYPAPTTLKSSLSVFLTFIFFLPCVYGYTIISILLFTSFHCFFLRTFIPSSVLCTHPQVPSSTLPCLILPFFLCSLVASSHSSLGCPWFLSFMYPSSFPSFNCAFYPSSFLSSKHRFLRRSIFHYSPLPSKYPSSLTSCLSYMPTSTLHSSFFFPSLFSLIHTTRRLEYMFLMQLSFTLF